MSHILTLQPDAAAGIDVYLEESAPSFNFGVTNTVRSSTTASSRSRILVRFDLSSIPVGATIVSAILTMWSTSSGGSAMTFDLHRSLVDWFEGASNNAAPGVGVNASTWNHKNANGSVSWGGAGGLSGTDYAGIAAASAIVNGIGPFDWDVTSEVAAFYASPSSNKGWWVIDKTASSARSFRSSDNSTSAERPRLVVTYNISESVSPTTISAVADIAVPTVLAGTNLGPTAISAVADTVDPTVAVGGMTFLGGNASAVGAVEGGDVSFTLSATPASAVAAVIAPLTLKGSMVLTGIASAIGGIGGLASLVDRTLRPAAASAVGETVGRVVALRIFPEICDPRPLLYLTDGTVKDNGQHHLLNLLDRDIGWLVNDWPPIIAQYKGGGTFSDNPIATGRRLARRVFANAIEIMECKVRGHNQDNLIGFVKELFSWQEAAADYWTSDWATRPIYIVAKAAKETNIRYAVVHMISCPQLENPYAQPFFDRTGRAALEAVTLRIERGDWSSTPPGEGECVEVSSLRSWTVEGWQPGDTTGGGGDETVLGDVLAMVQAGNGDVVIGTNNQARFYRSTDNGLTWFQMFKIGTDLTPNDSVNAITKDYAGNLYAAVTGSSLASGIWKSTSHGTAWTRVKSHPAGTGYNDIAYVPSNNTLVAVGKPTASNASPIAISVDAGVTWVEPQPPHYYYNFMSVASFDTPGLITLTPTTLNGPEAFFGTDSFYTIAGRASRSGGGFVKETASGQMGNGGLDMAAFGFKNPDGTWGRRALWAVKSAADVTDTEIWQWPNPANGTDTFGKIATIDGKLFNALYVDPLPDANSVASGRTIWAGANGEVYVSYNSGLTWSLATTAPVGQIRVFVRTVSGTLLAGGDDGEIFVFSGNTGSEGGGSGGESFGGGTMVVNSYSLGMEATCEDEVFTANKSTFSNVTHVLHYNGSTYVELQFATDPPYALLGTSPTTNKAAYFGSKTSDTNVAGGTFSNVVFDITQIAEDLTIVWEYWSGAAWSTLTVQDSSNGFRTLGVGSVHWTPPSGWATTTVNGTLGYWVRARISAVGGAPVHPIHDNRFIYTASLPYVEIAEGEIEGDLPASAQIRWHNRSDNATVELEMDRLVCGLRSVERGGFFNSFLNVSDVQIPFGITISKHAETSWGTVVRAPTTRALAVNITTGGLVNTWVDLVTFSISNSVARDYYGTFRAFVRCYKSGSGVNNWQLRVRTSFGSGGSRADSKSAFPTFSADWEILDLGQISIPTTQVSQIAGNLGDLLKLTIQGNTTATGIALTIYDLILIPTDEWAMDARSPELSEADTAKVKGGNFMDIDSITNPRVSLSVFNRNSANQIVSRYQAINNGPAILQKGGQQRLWFLAMSYENYWRAAPEVSGTVQVLKQQRYLAHRGRN